LSQLIRVLVVDDSAYVRKVVRQILSRSPFIEVVGAARDGAEALELVNELKPDVVTLDLIMPGMDGVTFLREQMSRAPLPVVILSITSESSVLAVKALEAGAVSMVQKPTALATEKVLEIGDELIEHVKEAAQTRVLGPAALEMSPPVLPRSFSAKTAVDAVVIGISTGGPQALKFLIPQLPADFPVPVAIVLHMPVGYTELYARSLAALSRLEVKEAAAGDAFRPGRVLLAPAGQHLRFARRRDGEVTAQLDLLPMDTPHRPAVDVLFHSAAEVFGSRVLGVIMTGMGSDGVKGAAWIKAQGGQIVTEAEETCVVYGMPRSAVEAGLSDRAVPLGSLAAVIQELV
jgi:two-component system chemotaxis response regulator CheB